VLGRVVDFQPGGERSSSFRVESLVQAADAVGVKGFRLDPKDYSKDCKVG
jgi:hypothetical protein